MSKRKKTVKPKPMVTKAENDASFARAKRMLAQLEKENEQRRKVTP